MDMLNTHTPPPSTKPSHLLRPGGGADKLEIHHTPKHGSWLNIAEIELSALDRQCLDRRLPDFARLETEVHAWQERRDAKSGAIDWRFTAEDATIKLKRLYPSIEE